MSFLYISETASKGQPCSSRRGVNDGILPKPPTPIPTPDGSTGPDKRQANERPEKYSQAGMAWHHAKTDVYMYMRTDIRASLYAVRRKLPFERLPRLPVASQGVHKLPLVWLLVPVVGSCARVL